MSDEPLSTTEHALLGALAQGGRMSGYDLKAYIDESIANFWSESFGQIYPALDRLERLGLVSSRRDDGSGRRRKVCEITPEGERRLSAWLAEPPAAEKPRNEMTLKTMLGAFAPEGTLRAHLEQYAETQERRARMLEGKEAEVRRTDAGSPHLNYAVAAIRAGIRIAAARAAWARETISLIEERVP